MIFAFFCRINNVRVVYDRKEVKVAKKWKQALLAGLTAGMVFVGSSQSVLADSYDNLMDAILTEETDNDEITDEETTEDFAEDTSYSLLRSTNLNFGTVKIKRLASNEIAIYGLTQCHKVCSKTYLYLYLERKVMVVTVHINTGNLQEVMQGILSEQSTSQSQAVPTTVSAATTQQVTEV